MADAACPQGCICCTPPTCCPVPGTPNTVTATFSDGTVVTLLWNNQNQWWRGTGILGCGGVGFTITLLPCISPGTCCDTQLTVARGADCGFTSNPSSCSCSPLHIVFNGTITGGTCINTPCNNYTVQVVITP
jgi:hypothetical protein